MHSEQTAAGIPPAVFAFCFMSVAGEKYTFFHIVPLDLESALSIKMLEQGKDSFQAPAFPSAAFSARCRRNPGLREETDERMKADIPRSVFSVRCLTRKLPRQRMQMKEWRKYL